MNQNIKNLIGIFAVLGVVAFALISWQYVGAFRDSIEPSSFRSFSVSGEGKVTATPDVAEVTFTVLTQGGENTAELQSTNAQKMNRVIEFVKAQDIADEDVETRQYSISPRYQNYNCDRFGLNPLTEEPCPPPDIVGYTVRQSAQVKIRDFENIGTILSGTVENGANSISGLSFSIEDRTQLEREARKKAIANAQEEAQAIAEAAGFTVGRLLGVDENIYAPFQGRAYAEGLGGAALDAAIAPKIEPGSQDITVNVNLRYEIK